MATTKTFSIENHPLANSDGVVIGVEVIFHGELVHGTPALTYKELQNKISELERLAASDVIAINLTDLYRWDSLGVTNVLEPIARINRWLKSRGRFPIGIIADKDSDNFKAARDKFPNEFNSEILPWFGSLKEFTNQID